MGHFLMEKPPNPGSALSGNQQSALSGLADVDAAVVTVAGMSADLAQPIAVLAIGAAVVANTIAKAAYALAFGSRAFGARFLGVSTVSLAIGAGVFIWAGRM
jgi:uncharacterized membrane protein (DUF4010 family)